MTARMEHHDLLSGLVRLHVLHHAAQHPVYGWWMSDELARHGYRLSQGTLYPLPAELARGLPDQRDRAKGARPGDFARSPERFARGFRSQAPV